MKKIILTFAIALASVFSAAGQEPAVADAAGLADFYLARDDGSGKAGEQVSGFYTTDGPIYCVVQLDSAAPATVRMNLVVVAVPGVKPGTRVVSTSYTTKENQNRVNFTGRPDGQWIAGRYRAEIYIGSNLAVSREFAVQSVATPKPAAEGIAPPRPTPNPARPAASRARKRLNLICKIKKGFGICRSPFRVTSNRITSVNRRRSRRRHDRRHRRRRIRHGRRRRHPTVTAAAAAVLTRFGFVHFQLASLELFSVQFRDRVFAVFLRRHFDEAETARAARVAVFDDRRRFHRSDGRKKLFKCGVVRVEREISYVKFH